MSSTILSDIRQIPPVTRFLTGSLLGVSMLYMLEIVWQNALVYRFHEVLYSYQVSGMQIVSSLAQLFLDMAPLHKLFRWK